MLQQLTLASELESDAVQDPVDWGRIWLVDFDARRAQPISFDRSNKSGDINMEMNGSVLEDK